MQKLMSHDYANASTLTTEVRPKATEAPLSKVFAEDRRAAPIAMELAKEPKILSLEVLHNEVLLFSEGTRHRMKEALRIPHTSEVVATGGACRPVSRSREAHLTVTMDVGRAA